MGFYYVIGSASKIFCFVNGAILVILALTCMLPFVNLLAISLSSQFAVSSNQVSFLPVGFNTKSYEFVLERI